MFSNTHYISRHLTINQETKIQELENITDRWVYFIKNTKKLEIIPKEFEDIKEFQEAFLIANQHNWSKEEMDEANAILKAEKKGVEKGEKNKQIEIVKNLLNVLDIETIALKTGLSVGEIEKLEITKLKYPVPFCHTFCHKLAWLFNFKLVYLID